VNTISGVNFTRSAKAPTISAGVMHGEGHLEDDEGVFGQIDVVAEGRGIGAAGHAGIRKALEKPPMNGPPLVKAIE
jgi:hypothetical protein